MPKTDEFMTIKDAAIFLDVVPNTLRNWGAAGKIPERRNPSNGYRLYARNDLEKMLNRIQESGEYPSGWSKPKKRRDKPR